jgi:hypothetical protein
VRGQFRHVSVRNQGKDRMLQQVEGVAAVRSRVRMLSLETGVAIARGGVLAPVNLHFSTDNAPAGDSLNFNVNGAFALRGNPAGSVC